MDGGDGLKAVRVRISGVVQGVGFRYFTRAVARDLGLRGYVRNMDDGSVEAVAEGEPERIDLFLDRVATGPPASSVSGLKVAEIPPSGYDDFGIRF